MIKVNVGNNMKRTPVIVDENTTLRTVLSDNRVDYSTAAPTLDGSTLEPGDLDKTFRQLGVTGECWLLCVQHKQNA